MGDDRYWEGYRDGCADMKERMQGSFDKARVEIERLQTRVRDAEIALRTWDGSRTSEYWEQYPNAADYYPYSETAKDDD